MKRQTLMFVALVALTGCDKLTALFEHSKPKPASTAPAFTTGTYLDGYDRLRQLACNKETARFFKLVDKEAMFAATMAHLEDIKKATKAMAPLVRRGFDEEMVEWEHDIDRGDKGFICQWEKVDSDHIWNMVTVKRASGKQSKLTFEERYVESLDRRDWVLVGVESN